MTSELKPCPFCENGGKPERHSMEHFVGNPSSGIVEMEDWVTCIICGASADTNVWNQRAERTCKMLKVHGDDGYTFVCSECNRPISYFAKDRYCPHCGAKVVD